MDSLHNWMQDTIDKLQCVWLQTASQSPSNEPVVHTYMCNLKTTDHIWIFSISKDCSTIGDIPCVVQSCMRDLTGELQPQICIGCSLIQHCVGILQVCT